MLRIISAKMAALPALLGDATAATQWNYRVENLKDRTMAFAVAAGATGEAMHRFFPTNSTVSGNGTYEYLQAGSEGYADARFFWAQTRFRRDRNKDCRWIDSMLDASILRNQCCTTLPLIQNQPSIHLTRVRWCNTTIVDEVFAILEEHGVNAIINGTSLGGDFVGVPELEQKLKYKLFCFGRHREEDPLSKEVQAALWTIEELLEVLRLRNDFVEMRVALANDE